MTHIAKLFTNGRSQGIRLPAAYRFDGTGVFIRCGSDAVYVTLSPRPSNWDGLIRAVREGGVNDVLNATERNQAAAERDPLAGDWTA
jgi:antitoxin VapB